MFFSLKFILKPPFIGDSIALEYRRVPAKKHTTKVYFSGKASHLGMIRPHGIATPPRLRKGLGIALRTLKLGQLSFQQVEMPFSRGIVY